MAIHEVSNSALRAKLGIRLEGIQEALATFTHYPQTEARDAWIWRKPNGKVDALTPPHLTSRASTHSSSSLKH